MLQREERAARRPKAIMIGEMHTGKLLSIITIFSGSSGLESAHLGAHEMHFSTHFWGPLRASICAFGCSSHALSTLIIWSIFWSNHPYNLWFSTQMLRISIQTHRIGIQMLRLCASHKCLEFRYKFIEIGILTRTIDHLFFRVQARTIAHCSRDCTYIYIYMERSIA